MKENHCTANIICNYKVAAFCYFTSGYKTTRVRSILPEYSTQIVSIFFVKVTIMGCIAVCWIGTKVSEVTVASIFRVEDKRQQVSKYIMVKKSFHPCLMYNVDLYVVRRCMATPQPPLHSTTSHKTIMLTSILLRWIIKFQRMLYEKCIIWRVKYKIMK